MQDILIILRRNLVTPVVISVYTLALLLVLIGERKDAFFITAVITVNIIFAIIQELRARHALHQLELLNAPKARLIDEKGDVKLVEYTNVAVGDILELIPGDEVPVDGVVTKSSGLEVNESMLTGESVSIAKPVDATVYAASAVTAGTAVMRVTAIGADTRTGQMTASLKRYNPELTPLQRNITTLITRLTWAALGLAVIIAVAGWLDERGTRYIIRTITSAGISIIPEGLILASTLLLAFGSLRLAQAKVLPQKLSAIEGMALLNLLAVDKTGTLTSDTITFDHFKLERGIDEARAKKHVGAAVHALGGGNSTSDALLLGLPIDEKAETIDILPFSSSRKLSAVRAKIDGEIITIMLGAPEFVAPYTRQSAKRQAEIDELTGQGFRVLLVVQFDDTKTALEGLTNKHSTVLGYLVLRNELRAGVEKTVTYLQDNGVSMRVISGDTPRTVQAVASQAGVRETDKIITGAELAKVTDKKWDEVVMNTTIFARVLPEQKERLIRTFKKNGKYTGMVGDGVNDALALKESDLGVAMYAGAAASRRVADIVLLNNSFTSLPMGMRLGNRIMLAISIISILFFHKIIYGVTVLFLTIILGIPYPFDPRHNTFMNIFMVTFPTLLWTFFPPIPQFRVNPRHFWRDTLRAVIPLALLSGITVSITHLTCTLVLGMSDAQSSTVCVVVATLLALNIVFLAERMMASRITRLSIIAQVVLLIISLATMSSAFGFSAVRTFFEFDKNAVVDISRTWPLLLLITLTMGIQHLLAYRARARLLREVRREQPKAKAE